MEYHGCVAMDVDEAMPPKIQNMFQRSLMIPAKKRSIRRFDFSLLANTYNVISDWVADEIDEYDADGLFTIAESPKDWNLEE